MSRKSLDDLGAKRRSQRLRVLLDNIDDDDDRQHNIDADADARFQPAEIDDYDDHHIGEEGKISESDLSSSYSGVMSDRDRQNGDESSEQDVEMDEERVSDDERGSNTESDDRPSLFDSAEEGQLFDDVDGESEGDENGGVNEQDNDQEFFRNDADWQNHRPVYQGAPLTVGQSLLMILALCIHHNLNMLCVKAIITVINVHCLQQGLAKMTLRIFQKYWALDEPTVKKHYYCSICFRELESVNHVCPSCPRKKNLYFVELQFLKQLKEMYQRDDFYNLLQWRFQRPLNRDGVISDVYDGSLYREWVQNGFLSNPNNISGPLWAYSCFQYEDLNGRFLKLVHGTWHLDTQIAKKHQQIIAMVKLVDRLPEGPVRDFCNSRKKQVKIAEYVFPGCYSVGYYKKLVTIPEIIRTAMTNSGYPQNPSIRQYFRLLKDGQLYVAEQYKINSLQTESFIIRYTGLDGKAKFGSIHSFVKTVLHCNCILEVCLCRGEHFAIIEDVRTDEVFSARGDHVIVTTDAFLRKFHLTENVLAVPVESLEAVCVRIKIEDELYVGIPINHKELE